jgi:eukaryotic-like serine/threonine-protein kinase
VKICPSCSEGFADTASFCPTCGEELKKSTDPYLGRTIAARYRLIKRLGSGGMSSVYLARHVIIERLSAIKILRQELSLNPAHRERFLREARAVNRINHENIVEITDYGESDGVTYLVMEYVQGETLLSHLSKGAFAWPRAARITFQVASALSRAHQAGVIHRDLKPENILLLSGSEKDEVKLTDFGIAKLADAPALTFNEQLFGTPGYIAPEYVESGTITAQSDIYSLGVVFYEALTSKLPFDARGQADLLFLPLSKAPIPPSQRVSGLPPEIESLVLRMLARVPADRPRDAFVVCDALTEALRNGGGASAPPPAQGVLRDASPTVLEQDRRPPESAVASGAPAVTREMSSRWHAALVDLNASIERARKKGHVENADRAAALVERAAEIVVRLERTSRTSGDYQAKVDLMESQAREFRANLGRAIDVLVHDRSRELAHLDALRDAAMRGEEARARAVVGDLDFQIEALAHQLEKRNEEHDRTLVEAAGALEGSLSALRVLQKELMRVVDDAAAAVAKAR